MAIFIIAFFVVAMCIAVIAGIINGVKQSNKSANVKVKHTTSPPPRVGGIDSTNIPINFPAEQRNLIQTIAKFYGIRYVTKADLQKYTIHKMGEDFAAMPGWDIWDISIHEAPGQYDRMDRAVLGKEISILCYDPEYQLAKVQGKTGIYLTSCKRCSCPDYRERRLPCKHMYALAIELDGNIDKHIPSQEYAPLYGLEFAIAGRFPGSRDHAKGVKSQLENLGVTISDRVQRNCSALVTGTSPSPSKLELASYYDMEVIPADIALRLFVSSDSSSKGSEETEIRQDIH